MIRSRMMWSVLVGCALVVGCEKKEETPSGAKATVPEAANTAAKEVKKGADATAEAANTASAESSAKLKQVMDAIKDKKWDIAETTLKGLEATKSSLPVSMQGEVDNARKMLDAAKVGLAAPSTPAPPK